jgi:hypothetical protein
MEVKTQNNCLFIFCHNWEIIDFYEKNIFINKSPINYKYVLLGEKHKAEDNKYDNKVIISCLLPINIESNKNYLQWCGWYSLVKNNLIEEYDYIYLFEYDVKLSDEFYNIFNNMNPDYDVHGFFKLDKNRYYLSYDYFSDGLCDYLENNNINVNNLININQSNWIQTSNIAIKPTILEKFINDVHFNNLLEENKNNRLIGHYLERFITVFLDINNINYSFNENILKHLFFDSHQTQNSNNFDLRKLL